MGRNSDGVSIQNISIYPNGLKLCVSYNRPIGQIREPHSFEGSDGQDVKQLVFDPKVMITNAYVADVIKIYSIHYRYNLGGANITARLKKFKLVRSIQLAYRSGRTIPVTLNIPKHHTSVVN